MITTESTTRKTRTHRGLWLLLAVPLVLGAGIYAFRAYAMGPGFGCGLGMGGCGAGMGFGPGMAASPEMRKAFMERRLNMALNAVKATDSQRTAVKSVFARTFAEMQPVHEQRVQLHDAFVAAFGAEVVDRAVVEKLRSQAAALFDQGSQAFTRALLDASQVLSADQRQALIKFMHERPGRGRGRGFGPGPMGL